jgi:hypothetical protein
MMLSQAALGQIFPSQKTPRKIKFGRMAFRRMTICTKTIDRMTRSKMMLSTMILGQNKLFYIDEESNVAPRHSVARQTAE